MGTAPPSKPLSEPAKPFKRKQHRACLQNTFLPKPRKDPTVLLHLISRREWQKVLIRVTLFPSEVTQRQKMTWYGVQWSLLPLHLACALQPPSEVISMLLSFHSDTARVPMNRCSPSPLRKKRPWRRSTNKKKLATSEHNNYALYQSNQGQHYVVPKIDTAPSSSDDEELHPADDGSAINLNTTDRSQNYTNSDSGSLLDDEAFIMDADRSSRLHVFETHDESTDGEDEHSDGVAVPPEMLPDYKEAPAPDYAANDHNDETTKALKKPTNVSLDKKRNVVLQLSANGSLNPIEVDSLSVSRNPGKMQWNLDPLLMEADVLLPLHIACLYRASPTVITHLMDAYPKAVHENALGMLPIHMACAGFELPSPILAPPPGPVPFPMDDEYDMPETLRRLENAFPESLFTPSDINGMTPKTYIDETLDDGSYKDECLEALGVTREELVEEEEIAETRVSEVSDYDNTTLTTRVPDEVHCVDDNSTLPSFQTETSSKYLGQDLPQIHGFSGSRLYSKMLTKNWESALSIIEEHPKDARIWQYGIELDRIESMNSAGMWKRLPIHSACVLHAPIGLIEALLWAYPKGIEIKDPFTGALPLHLACRHSAPPELVKTVITGYPEGSRITDDIGRLPLHLACLSGASRLTFIYLLKAHPHAVIMKDDRRKSPLQYAKQNPTLRSETVELLELVHHFLENQPEVEDDYSFEGFQSSRSVGRGSDDGSVVSGFYETRSVASPRRTTNSEDDLDSSPLSGSQASEDKETAERLVKEFSQILEEKDVATTEDEPTVTKLAPRFSSDQNEIDHDLPLPTDRSNVEIEVLSKISEEDSALDDTETEPEDGTSDPEEVQICQQDKSFEGAKSIDTETEPEDYTPDPDEMKISDEDNSFEAAKSIENEEALAKEAQSKLGALMTRNEDSLTPEGSLMCLNGNGELTSDDQDNSTQEEAEVEETLEDAYNDDDAADETASGISEASPSCASVKEDAEDHSLPSKKLDQYIEEHSDEEASDTDGSQDHSYRVDDSVEAIEQELPSGDRKSAATGLAEVNHSSSKAKSEEVSIPLRESCNALSTDRIDRSIPDNGISATVLPSRDVDPADEAAGCFSPANVPAYESSNEDVAPSEADTDGIRKAYDLSRNADAQVVMNKNDKTADGEFVPYQPLVEDADAVEASTTASNDESISLQKEKGKTADVEIIPYHPLVEDADAVEASTTASNDKSISLQKEKDKTADVEFIPYQPLTEDADEVEASTTASNDQRISLESLSSRPESFIAANNDCSYTDVTVLASNTLAQMSQRASVYTGDSAASLLCPNPGTITDGHESENIPNENSLEFQFDYKSDLSQTGDSVIDVESVTSTTFSEPHDEDEPVLIQERDDQNKTSSPKQEERLDIL